MIFMGYQVTWREVSVDSNLVYVSCIGICVRQLKGISPKTKGISPKTNRITWRRWISIRSTGQYRRESFRTYLYIVNWSTVRIVKKSLEGTQRSKFYCSFGFLGVECVNYNLSRENPLSADCQQKISISDNKFEFRQFQVQAAYVLQYDAQS